MIGTAEAVPDLLERGDRFSVKPIFFVNGKSNNLKKHLSTIFAINVN